MGKKSRGLILVIFLFVPFSSFALVNREYDPVVIEGKYLAKSLGEAPGNLRLFSYKDGKFEQIPYQIDERMELMLYKSWTRRMRVLSYVFNVGDKIKPDYDPSFDADDELVFMARDAGKEAPGGVVPESAKFCEEIVIRDKESSKRGYVYLCSFNIPPLPSERKYVVYKEAENQFIGESYQISYPEDEPLFFNELRLKGEKESPNLVDSFKIQFDCYGLFGALVYLLNNSNLTNFSRGIKVGPVRIVNEIVTFTEPWFNVQVRVINHIIYYPHIVEMEIMTRPPVSWYNLHNFNYYLTLDLNKNANGSIFLTEKNTKGVVIDGVLDKEELEMDYSTQEWMAVDTRYGTIYSHLDLPQLPTTAYTTLYPDLYYVDMEYKADPPENEHGMFGKFGFTVRNLQTGRKPLPFRLVYLMAPERYQPGKEDDFLNVYKNPLEVESGINIVNAMKQSPPAVPDKRKEEEKPRATQAPKVEKAAPVLFVAPSFILDPYNTGYGAGISLGTSDLFHTGIGFGLLTLTSTRNYYSYGFDISKLRIIPGIDDLKISGGLEQFPSESFWGLGNESERDNRVIYWWTRNRADITFSKHFLYQYAIDVGIRYRDTKIKPGQQPIEGPMKGSPSLEEHFGFDEDIEDGERWGGPLYGLDGGISNGIAITLSHDMRNDWRVPHRGSYQAITIDRVGPELGSDYNYTKVTLDLRGYYQPEWLNPIYFDKWVNKKRTFANKFFGPDKQRAFAGRIVLTKTFSEEFDSYYGQENVLDVPFYELPTLGGSLNRAYEGARFRGNDLAVMSLEYRWKFWYWADAALFVDYGYILDDMFDPDSWDTEGHLSYGFTLRGSYPPGFFVSLEYSFSDENRSGLFTQMGYSF